VEGADTAQVYLPSGYWIHYWSQQEYALEFGTWINVNAPIGFPAVFTRSNSTAFKVLKKLWNAKFNTLNLIKEKFNDKNS
jgi:alpha-glucosidase (family GH31 glycosyl hydrolase)